MFTYVHDMHTVNTRSSSDNTLMLPKSRLTKSQSNLSFRGAQYFNKLPQSIRSIETLASESHESTHSELNSGLTVRKYCLEHGSQMDSGPGSPSKSISILSCIWLRVSRYTFSAFHFSPSRRI